MSKSKVGVIAYCYRYFWKLKDGSLCVRYITDVLEGHITFQNWLRDNENIVSSYREYQYQVDYAFIGFTEPVKEEKKEEKENEKKIS